MSKAEFGWTVIYKSYEKQYVIYKRDCPATKEFAAEDLAKTTFPTRREAEEYVKSQEWKETAEDMMRVYDREVAAAYFGDPGKIGQ